MKKYILKANDFVLEIELAVFEEDIDIPINSMLNVKIYSDNFSAATTMDMDIRAFRIFAEELFNVYTSLQGCAELKEPYGNSFIIFKAMTNGHIHVNGVVYNHCISGHEQELRFENEFDQTYLREFVNEIDNATSRCREVNGNERSAFNEVKVSDF